MNHGSQPPPYSAEYDKPPPYYSQAPPTAAPVGWTHPQPPHSTHSVPQQQGNSNLGTRPTVITVTTTPTYVIASQPTQHQNVQVLQLGNCPACRVGFLRNEFDICGILLAILFFPFGILCCFCMMEKRCSHCGARF